MTRQYIQKLGTSALAVTPCKSVVVPSLKCLRPSLPSQQQRLLHGLPGHPSSNAQNSTTMRLLPPSKPLTRHHMYSTLHATPVAANKQQTAATAAKNTIPDDDDASEPHAKHGFDFFVYAAWHPKNRSARQRRANVNIPYWKQKQVGKVDAGEDAFFQTCTPSGLALGVADGVGGWSEVGVDPALFSWTLMNNAASAAKADKQLDAHNILDVAFDRLVQDGKVQAGSSTACILNLCKTTGKMTTCNLGDSAFLLIRDQKVVYESPSQQHYFNCPYQLTVVPETYPDRDLYVTDMPKDGDQKSFFLKDGDVIVLATDGYFDNVYAQETLAMVNHELDALSPDDDDETRLALVRRLSKTLTDTAKRLSLDPKRLSPWAKGAQAHGSSYLGGKVDDIVCLVTLVRNGATA